ncbi:hypothetical protein LCGC14_3091900 [marine sediment metagenome]|uniref:Uncharacterized protein n=1 Tax=marine sediment metagenome TaxID=412755 RepID=A0A0F8YHN7_9ZZZZ
MTWGQKIKPTILLKQNNKVNLDGHVIVRGIMVERQTIAEMEDEVGGRLIPDQKNDLLRVLDEITEYIRVRNNGNHTPERTIEYMNERYVHRDLTISADVFSFQWDMNWGLGDVAVRGTKKVWFQKPISLAINRSKAGAVLLP